VIQKKQQTKGILITSKRYWRASS